MHSPLNSPREYSTQENVSAGLDVGAWIRYLLEKKWIFIWSTLICTLIGVVLSFTLTRMYAGVATVLVEDPPNVIPGQSNGLVKDIYAAPEALKAVEGSFKSDTLLLRIVKVNHLDLIHPAFQAKLSDPPMDDAKLIEVMTKRFGVKAQRGSRLIDVQVLDEDPVLARRLTQSAIDEYIKLMYGSAGGVVATANAELEREADEIRQRLEKSEQQLQAYREKYNTTSIEDKKNLSSEKLRQLNQQLTDVKANRIRLESQVGGIVDVDKTPLSRLSAIQSIASQQDVGALQKSLGDAEAVLAQAQKNYGPRHPAYFAMESAVRAMRNQLKGVVRNHARALVNEYKSAAAAETNLTQQLASDDKESVNLAGISIPYAMLEREEQANKSMYDQLLERMRANKVEQNVNQMNIRQIQYPVLPNRDEPVKPRVPLVLGLAIIGGFGLAFGYVLVSRATDSSFRSIDEAEHTLQAPVLAAIRFTKLSPNGRRKPSALLQLEQPASAQAEAIRGLRTALALLPDGQPQTVLFISSVPAEGKSFCAANYAIALAQQGLRTLLLEADLRRPFLSAQFSDVPGRPGLSDYLSGTASPEEISYSTRVTNLSFIPAGRQRSRPAELLAQKAETQNLFRTLASYDCVVIDSAPILAVSDPLLLAPFAEAVVLVVRARKTQQKELNRALQLLAQAGVQLSGLVLNRLPRQQTYSYSEYAGEYTEKAI